MTKEQFDIQAQIDRLKKVRERAEPSIQCGIDLQVKSLEKQLAKLQ